MVENRGSQVSGVAGFFLALTWLFVAARLYSRICFVKSFSLDDYLCVMSQLLYTFFCGFAIAGVAYGTGQHAVDIVPQSNIAIGLKWWWACEPVYVMSNMFLKFSICIFLLRIAISKPQRYYIWIIMTGQGIISTYYFFLFIFQCWPVEYFWGQAAGMQGTCIDTKIISNSAYAYSAINCWTDWSCCILPAFMVWKLQMNPRTKFSVCLILAVSSIASAATIIRIPYIQGLTHSEDFLFATTDVAIWSIAENGLGISACAAATLRPLFKTFLSRSRLFGGSTYKNTSGSNWGPSRKGYIRNESHASRLDEEEIGLRTNVQGGKNVGFVEAVSNRGTDMDQKSINTNTSQTKLTESDGFGSQTDWANGIRKTTVVTTERGLKGSQ